MKIPLSFFTCTWLAIASPGLSAAPQSATIDAAIASPERPAVDRHEVPVGEVPAGALRAALDDVTDEHPRREQVVVGVGRFKTRLEPFCFQIVCLNKAHFAC